MVLADLEARMQDIPGIKIEVLNLSRGPASAKPVHLRLKSDDWETLLEVTAQARAKFEATAGLTDI